jgi:hypothetical protein
MNDETRIDIICLAIAYLGAAFFTWVGIWSQAHGNSAFDVYGFMISHWGLK